MKNTIGQIAVLVTVSFFLMPALAQAKKIKLTGSQQAGNIGHGPTIKSPTIVLASATPIVKVDRKADSYSIWKNGEVYVTVTKGVELSGVLPAGRYVLRPSIGNVSIYLDTAAKPKVLTLWRKQNRGPNHWIKGNVVLLAGGYQIIDFRYNGTDGVGIFPKGGHHPVFRYISAHNVKEKGPAVMGPKGKLPTKTLKGLKLGPGVFVVVPGIGTADKLVETEIKLKAI